MIGDTKMKDKIDMSFERTKCTKEDFESSGCKKKIAINNIKKWISEKKDAEIRMGLKQAEDLGIDLSDESIIKMFENGIVVDIVISNLRRDDYLPLRLEKIRDDMVKKNEGFVRVKVVSHHNNRTLEGMEIVNILIHNLSCHDFRVNTKGDNEDFVTLRISSLDKKSYLTSEDVYKLLSKIIPSDDFDVTVVPNNILFEMLGQLKKGI